MNTSRLLIFAFALLLLVFLFLWAAPIYEHRPIDLKFFPVDRNGVTGKGLINDKAYMKALKHLSSNRARIKNKNYLAIIDYTKPSYRKRLYIVNLKNGEVERFLVAHGKNSGKIMATEFSNEIDSNKSCKGFFITGKPYIGKHGASLALHGLEPGKNNNAQQRGIVIHGADYVSLRSIILNGGRLGRSLGCPAVSLQEIEKVIEKIKNGSLLYIHADS